MRPKDVSLIVWHPPYEVCVLKVAQLPASHVKRIRTHLRQVEFVDCPVDPVSDVDGGPINRIYRQSLPRYAPRYQGARSAPGLLYELQIVYK